MIEPGTLLAGKYRTVRPLATGGMGMVLLVRHEVLGQRAAIKILRPDALQSRDANERFLREARASANLRSDHVARVFDVGSLDDGAPYMVMEYLEGRDLAEELKRRGRLPASEAVDCTLQAIDAVAEAHAIGVIHRDLKPSNLFLVSRADGSRHVKVLDFGISKVVSSLGDITDGAVTTDNALLGSPAYMSPEQVKSSKDVDGRTDVWSLGVVLHELITGCRAFEGETVGAILSSILCDDAPLISRVVPDVPPGLDRVVERCLERNRELRYESVLALRDALVPYASERTRRTLPPRSSMPPAAPELTMASASDEPRADETTIDVSSPQSDPRGGITVAEATGAPDGVKSEITLDTSPDRRSAAQVDQVIVPGTGAPGMGLETTAAVSSDRRVAPVRQAPSRSLSRPLVLGGVMLAAVAVWLGARSPARAPEAANAASNALAVGVPSVLVPVEVAPPATSIAPHPIASASASASASVSAAVPATSPRRPAPTATVAAKLPAPTAKPPAPRAASINLDERD